MKKKFIAVLLCMVQLSALFGFRVLAANDNRVGNRVGPFSIALAESCELMMELTEKNAYEGKSLHVVRKADYAPNRYLMLYTHIPVETGKRYQYSAMVKAEKVTYLVARRAWQHSTDLLPLGDTFDWVKVTYEYECTSGGSEEFQIALDGPAKNLWLDNIEFRCINEDGTLGPNLIPEADFDGGKTAVVTESKYVAENVSNKLGREGAGTVEEIGTAMAVGQAWTAYQRDGIAIDADLSDWKDNEVVRIPSAQSQIGKIIEYTDDADCNMDVQVAYDEQNYYIAAKVTDDKPPKMNVPNNYELDSFQFNFGKEDSVDYYGYVLAIRDGKAVLECPFGDADDALQIQYAATETEEGYVYEIAVPRNIIFGGDSENLTFNVLVNDNDGEGRATYLQWKYGIGEGAGSPQYGRLLLISPEDTFYGWINQKFSIIEMKTPQSMEMWLVNPTDQAKTLSYTDLEGEHSVSVPASSGVLVKVSDQAPEIGVAWLGATVKDENGVEKEIRAYASAELNVDHYITMFDELEKEYTPKIDALMKQCDEMDITYEYENADYWVFKRFIEYGKDDAKNGKKPRAEYVYHAIKKIADSIIRNLEAYLANEKTPITPSRYASSKPRADGMTLWAQDDSGRERPVYFAGYGHFSAAVDEIPNFGNTLGVNVIQVEIGPNTTVIGEDDNGNFITNPGNVSAVIGRALSSGKTDNVSVAVLLSPHYIPGWFSEKYPGIETYAVPHPKMRQLIETHIRTVMSVIKNEVALHSICLTNEYNIKATWPEVLPDYHKFLEERFNGDIKALNAAYQTKYKSFDDVEFLDGDLFENVMLNPDMEEYQEYLPQFSDWIEFNDRYFAEFHGWMNSIVQEEAPGTLVGAKIMQNYDANERAWRRQFVRFGTDPELMGQTLSINGNDANNYYKNSLWGILCKANYYDLQTSVAEKPVFDYESHVVVDRDRSYGQPFQENHVAADVWQLAINGRGGSAMWVWERTYDDSHSFSDSILHRPDMLQKANYAMLDLGRLGYEMNALQEADRTVAVMYSKTARTYSLKAMNSLVSAYEAAAYTGERIRHFTEKQLRDKELKRENVDVMIIPYATHVIDGTLEGIADYIREGGNVVIIGEESLSYNDHNQPLDAELRKYVFENSKVFAATATERDVLATPTSRDIWNELLRIKTTCPDETPVMITDTLTGSPVFGANYVAAEYEGNLLVNLCDYDYIGDKIVDVRYNGVKIDSAKELRSLVNTKGSGIGLTPYSPILLSVPVEDLPKPVTEFEDMKNHWAKYSVLDLSSEGVIKGVSATEFAPDRTITAKDFEALVSRTMGKEDGSFKSVLNLADDHLITREEMAVLLIHAYTSQKGEVAEADLTRFTDAGESTYQSEIAKAVELGILTGNTDGTLAPKSTATRAQAAATIFRLKKCLEGYSRSAATEQGSGKTDNSKDELIFFDR